MVALETLRSCGDRKLGVAVYVSSAVQEEIGTRGAKTATTHLKPEIGITVDVCTATDDPGNNDKTMIPARIGRGPCISSGPNTNLNIFELLRESAERCGISYQVTPSGELAGNDSKAVQVASAGVATADIGIPNRNMHSQREMSSLDDIDNSIKLLADFFSRLTETTELRPFYKPDTPPRDR